MKAKVQSIKVAEGANPTASSLTLTAQVTDTKTGAATLNLFVERHWTAWKNVMQFKVSLVKSWATKKFYAEIGVSTLDDVTGLRTAALKAAQAFWDTFTLTPEQKAALPQHVAIRPELDYVRSIHADITALPFGPVTLWGVVTYTAKEDGTLDLNDARLFTSDPGMAIDTGRTRENRHGVVFSNKDAKGHLSTYADKLVSDAIYPMVHGAVTSDLVDDLRAHNVKQLQATIEDAKERAENARWDIVRAENMAAMAYARIEDPTITDAGECRECHLPVYRAKDGNLFHLNVQWTATPDEVTAGEKGHAPKLDEGRAA